MNFGERLKELRIKKQYTQSQLADILGVSKSNISKYEAGSVEPNLDIIANSAKHLGVSTDYLLGISDEYEIKESTTDASIQILAKQLKNLLSEDSSLDVGFYAQAGHMSASSLQKFINGEAVPSIYEFCKLIEIFNTTADFLFGKSTIPHPNNNHSTIRSENSFSDRLNSAIDGNYLETELADKLDISISKIKKLLNNEEIPTPTILEEIAQILEKSTDYVLGISDFSRSIDSTGRYPFHMETKSIERLQKIIGNDWNEMDAELLGLTNSEFYMMYHYGFIPHISILQKLCKKYNVSSDYLLNLSDSKISILITKDYNEEKLINRYRSIDNLYQERVNGFISEQILQQERDKYMRSTVAADERLGPTGTDSMGK